MDDSQIPVFIEGEIIHFVPLNSKNVNLFAKWKNTPEVRIYSRNIFPRTIEDMKKKFEPSNSKTKRDVFFEVWHKKDKKTIGLGRVGDIDWYGQKAWLGLEIGEPEYWGQKIGEEVTHLMVEYAFNELNLYKIYAGVSSANIGSWSCAEKNGFIREATFKKDMYIDGKYFDRFVYSLLKEDWLKNKKEINSKL